jgi:hypothetical protein
MDAIFTTAPMVNATIALSGAGRGQLSFVTKAPEEGARSESDSVIGQ